MIKRILIIFIHMFIGWAACAALIGIGRSYTTMENTLIIHGAAVPIIFGLISFVYFKKFNYTSPLRTGIIFLLFIVAMDFFVVAILVEKSLAMFKSLLGSWIPFASIFITVYLVGIIINYKKQNGVFYGK